MKLRLPFVWRSTHQRLLDEAQYRERIAIQTAVAEGHRALSAERSRENARIELQLMRETVGITRKMGGSFDVDYEKLTRALGAGPCTSLRGVLDEYLAGRNIGGLRKVTG